MRLFLTLSSASLLLLAACAHERVSQNDQSSKMVSQVNGSQARVHTAGNQALRSGDRVNIYRVEEFCDYPQDNNVARDSCRTKLGEGRVTQVLSNHDAMIQAQGIDLDNADFVIKQVS